jgi:hypothetical protein
MKPACNEGEDFYYNQQGNLVFTESFHLNRGYCCGNGCMNCPYDYDRVPEPRRSELLSLRHEQQETRSQQDSIN